MEQVQSLWRRARSLQARSLCREWAAWRRETGLEPLSALKRGLTLADEVLAVRPRWADALLLRASLREEAGMTREAWEDLKRALALNPHLAGWWKRRFPGRATPAP
jgi:eukaryotic-like serine/threonine-protein kinase